jgi:glycosyltransferase involved in cell wall biosynthesis
MIKIALDARMLNHSGIGTYLRNMIPVLSEEFQLTLLGNKSELTDYSNTMKILQFESSIYSVKEQIELYSKIPKCDVFISPHYNVPILPVKARKRIVIIHDVFHLAFYKNLSLKQKLYAKFMINYAIRNSDKVITVSEFSKSEIIKYTSCNPQKLKVIYCGIDEKDFQKHFSVDLAKKIKQKYNLPEKYFLFVSNIKPHKNLKNLLLAFKLFLNNNNYKLVIVGKKEGLITQDSEAFDIVENDTNLNKKVIFTGYISNDEIVGFYKLATALIFPSFYEGFGLPTLEAMICNCPVISSTAASLPEACGDAALYFEPNNPLNIKEQMKKLIADENLRTQLIKKGTENYKKFNKDIFSKKLSETIMEVA